MRKALPLSAALLGMLLLAGCGASGSDATSEPMMAGAPVEATGTQMALSDKGVAPQQQIITTAWMTIRVTSIPDATAQVSSEISSVNGVIQQQDATLTDGSASATITARVPASSLDDFIAAVSEIGVVESSSRQASDVTQQSVDLDARIAALTASVTRLKELLAQAATVADLVAVETELANRQAELDSLVSQRTYLDGQVAMSTVTISLLPTVAIGGWQAPGFLAGLQNGISALVASVGVAITAAGFVLPFIAIAALIAIPVIWLLIRRSRRRQP